MEDLKYKIDRIYTTLRRDEGIRDDLQCVEQFSWILLLKYLDDKENKYFSDAYDEFSMPFEYKWKNWTSRNFLNSDELIDFVNNELFLFFKHLKNTSSNPKSIKYQLGAVFGFITNKIVDGNTLKDIINIVDSFDLQSSEKNVLNISNAYENLLKQLGTDSGNSGEFYTPRSIVKAMVRTLEPKIGEKIYDGAIGSAGFFIESFQYILDNSIEIFGDKLKLEIGRMFYGQEKTSLGYLIAILNIGLHGIENSNIFKADTLDATSDYLENSKYDIILSNPPFGIKIRTTDFLNLTNETYSIETLFLQHYMDKLSLGGRAAIIVPEGVLSNVNAMYKNVREKLLKKFNVHTIVSLPSGAFLPYTAVKTSILYFNNDGKGTSKIWYCEIVPPYKLTKNKPLESEHWVEFIDLFRNPNKRNQDNNYVDESCTNWTVAIDDILDFNLSLKNPNKLAVPIPVEPKKILNTLRERLFQIIDLTNMIENSVQDEFSNQEIYITKSLGDVAKIVSGKTFKNEELVNDGKFKVVRLSNLFSVNKDLYYSNYVTEDDKYCIKGDLMYPSIGSYGPKIWEGEKAFYDQNIWKIITNSNFLLNKYLFYILEKNNNRIREEYGRGSSRQHISKTSLESLMLKIPPLEVQRRVVVKLDEYYKNQKEIIDIRIEIDRLIVILNQNVLDLNIS